MAIRLILLLALGGCSFQPVISAHHYSDPRINNDGWNSLCAGAERGEQLIVRGEVCDTFGAFDYYQYVHVSVEYRP